MTKKYFTILLVVKVLILLLVCATALFAISKLNDTTKQKNIVDKKIEITNTLLTKLIDAETGQRGYVITGQDTFLEPYQQAVAYLSQPPLQTFLKEGRQDPDTKSEFGNLEQDINAKMHELKQVIDVRKDQNFEAAQAIILDQVGKKLMDDIRKNISSIRTKYKNNLDELSVSTSSYIEKLFALVIAFNLIAFIFVCIFFYIQYRAVQKRKKTEANLTKMNSLWSAIFQSASEAIITLDAKGNITSYNRGAEELFSYRPEEILGKPFTIFFNAVEMDRRLADLSKKYNISIASPIEILRALDEKVKFIDETWLAQKKNGTSFALLLSLTLLKDSDNKVQGFLLIGRDITEREKWEMELMVAREQSLLATQAKSRFLANMSHDLRTPFNSIIGFSTILLKNKTGNLTEVQIDQLQRIFDNGKRLLNLINSILDLSKIESGKADINVSPIDLSEFIQTILKELEGHFHEKKVELISEIPEKLEPLATDPQKLSQILTNLIGNSIKFTKEGYVKVKIEKDEKNHPIRIDVIDTGIGMDEAELSRIFEAFYQIDNELDRKYQGSGLGLSIAQSLCKLLGFKLSVQSEVGKGSTFTLLLNAAEEGAFKNRLDVHLAQRLSRPSGTQKTVLIIDDDVDARYLLSQYFKDLNCTVYTAGSGKEGVEMAKQIHIDLITIDIKMTPMDGYQLINILQQDEKLKSIPFAVISNFADEAKSKLNQFAAVLSKPVSMTELGDLLK